MKLYVRPIRARVTYDTSTIGYEVVRENLERVAVSGYRSEAVDAARKQFAEAEIVDGEHAFFTGENDGPLMDVEVVAAFPYAEKIVLRLPTGRLVALPVPEVYADDVRDALRRAR